MGKRKVEVDVMTQHRGLCGGRAARPGGAFCSLRRGAELAAPARLCAGGHERGVRDAVRADPRVAELAEGAEGCIGVPRGGAGGEEHVVHFHVGRLHELHEAERLGERAALGAQLHESLLVDAVRGVVDSRLDERLWGDIGRGKR